MTRLAEGALGIREDLGRCDREHGDCPNTFAVKGSVAHLVVPSSVPLGGPRVGKTLKHIIVSDLHGVAFDHDV